MTFKTKLQMMLILFEDCCNELAKSREADISIEEMEEILGENAGWISLSTIDYLAEAFKNELQRTFIIKEEKN